MTYRCTYSYEISLYVLTPVYKLGIQVNNKTSRYVFIMTI